MHHFSWRLGLVVILVIFGIFALLYPYVTKRQSVPVRQTTEIRQDSTNTDSAARQAIERDTN